MRPNIIKVLTVINSLNLGGIENTLLRVLPYLKKEGIEMDICCLSKEKGVLEDGFISSGCNIYHIKKHANPILTMVSLIPILKKQKYQVLHSSMGYISGGYALAGIVRSVPVAVSFHSSECGSIFSWRQKFLLKDLRNLYLMMHRKIMTRSVSAYVGHSKINIENYFPRWRDSSKYRVIYNGVELGKNDKERREIEEQFKIPKNRKIILHIGSFREQKNHLALVKIFEEVRRKVDLCHLVMVGEGPDRSIIKQIMQRKGLLREATFIGSTSDAYYLYGVADCFLFTSIVEGFGVVLVESQLSRVPVVASNIPGHRESVCPAQHKHLFDLGDVQIASSNVIKVLEGYPGKNKDIQQSFEFAQDFNPKKMAGELLKLYQDLDTK